MLGVGAISVSLSISKSGFRLGKPGFEQQEITGIYGVNTTESCHVLPS